MKPHATNTSNPVDFPKTNIMNKRLLELAKQSGLKKEHASNREYVSDFDWRHFAQLIVKECAEVVDNDDSAYPYDSFGHKLKHHFGVE